VYATEMPFGWEEAMVSTLPLEIAGITQHTVIRLKKKTAG
jgi:hypothetical protein